MSDETVNQHWLPVIVIVIVAGASVAVTNEQLISVSHLTQRVSVSVR